MKDRLPTRGQLERQLSQTLQSIYRQKFGHSIGKITCDLLTNKVGILAEDAVTQIEKTLLNNSQVELAHSLRKAIDKIFVAQVKQTVSNILQVEVIDIISDCSLDSGYLGILVFLTTAPKMRLARVLSDENRIQSEYKVVLKQSNISQPKAKN